MGEVLVKDMQLYELYYILCVSLLCGEDIVSYDINEILSAINEYYNVEEGHYMDSSSELYSAVLFSFAREKTRYKLLDELMLHVYNRFINKDEFADTRDMFFISNIDEMKAIMDYEREYIIENMGDKECEVPKISLEEVIIQVKKVLKEIDPSGEWLNIYNEAIDNNHIIYLDKLTETEKDILKKKIGIDSLDGISNSCFFPDNETSYIMLKYKGNITDIPTTVHEIVHYICRIKNNHKMEKLILREFPSIFFEFYALNYLKKMGYDSEVLKTINDARFVDTKQSLEDISNMTDYLIMLIRDGEITSDERNKICDNCTYDLVINPYVYFKSYPYIIGNYLAISGMQHLIYDKEIVSKIKYVSERISTIDPYDVFKIVGHGNMNNLTRTKSKKRTKKK